MDQGNGHVVLKLKNKVFCAWRNCEKCSVWKADSDGFDLRKKSSTEGQCLQTSSSLHDRDIVNVKFRMKQMKRDNFIKRIKYAVCSIFVWN